MIFSAMNGTRSINPKTILATLAAASLMLLLVAYGGKKIWSRALVIYQWQPQEQRPVLSSPPEWQETISELRATSEASLSPSPTLVVVTAAWCPQCKKLEQALTEATIPFIPADIDTTPQGARLDKILSERGVVVVPQAIVDNYLVWPQVSYIKERLAGTGASDGSGR